MKTLEYHTLSEEKKKWGDGPWVDEPDKMQWRDEETGLPCLIVRSGASGGLCGYVGVGSDHRLFAKEYIDLDESPDVHGGLTFSSFCQEPIEGVPQTEIEEKGICHLVEPGEEERVWWFGFDCGHMNDYSPKTEMLLKEAGHEWPESLQKNPMFMRSYKTVEYVKQEIKTLAKQLSEL